MVRASVPSPKKFGGVPWQSRTFPRPFPRSSAPAFDATVNYEGGLAFQMPATERLMTRVFASLMGEPKYYETAQASDNAIFADVHAAATENPEMVLRIAAYGRQVMNMRSTPIAVLTEAAAIPACKPFVRRWTPQIVRRADEPAEVIALWVKQHGPIGSQGAKGGEHAFPNSLTRGHSRTRSATSASTSSPSTIATGA